MSKTKPGLQSGISKTTLELYLEDLKPGNADEDECDCYETAETSTGRFLEIREESYKQAVEKVTLLSPPEITSNVMNLGSEIQKEYARIYSSLDEPANTSLNSIKWLRTQSVSYALTWQGWITEGLKPENDFAKKLLFELGAGNIDRLATIFYRHITIAEGFPDGGGYPEFSSGVGFFETYGQLDHYALALVWFCNADTLIKSGNIIAALDKIADAYLAITQGMGNAIWIAKGKEEDAYNSHVARTKAQKRHLETYAKRDAVIAYWRENISPAQANEFAAELLQKNFPDIAHRTLVKYVAEAKKLPPASTV